MIRQAAEIWNTQARGTKLVYRGPTSHDPHFDFCDAAGIAKPAIIVTFREGCRLKDGCDNWQQCPPTGDPTGCPCDDSDCAGSVGSIRLIRDSLDQVCSDAVLIEIVGDRESAFGCDGVPINWNIDMTDDDGRQLINVLVHEFGHALGLGHPAPGLISGDDESAIMPPGGNRRHLGTWDKDCVDDPLNAGSSKVHLYLRSSTSTGGWASHIATTFLSTFRGAAAYGYWQDGPDRRVPHYYTEHEYFPSWHGSHDPSPLASILLLAFNPFDEWSLWVSFSSMNSSMLAALDSTPVMFQRRSAGSGDGQRINFTWDRFSSDPPTPQLRYRRSDDLFNTSGWGRYEECLPSIHDCSGWVHLNSSIPIAHAYDPYSSTDVMVTVLDTNDIDGGRIQIHAGFHPTAPRRRLNPGYEVSSSVTTHWSSGQFGPFPAYSFLTDFLPGVACAPDREQFDYNCIIAWSDRVVPNGRIHYTYFRVEPNAAIEIHPTTWTRGGSRTTSHVSAGYFYDSFWLGWKDWNSQGVAGIATTRNTGAYASWTSPDRLSRPRVVDPPSFVYEPELSGTTARQLWTEAPCCDP